MDEKQQTKEMKFQVSESIIKNLNITRKWGKFLAIVNFVILVFLALLGIFFIVGGASLGLSMNVPTIPFTIIGFIYLIIAIISFIPMLYLYRFTSNMEKAINLTDEESFDTSFRYLKAYFRFLGILTLISLTFLVLSIIFSMVFAFIGSSQLLENL